MINYISSGFRWFFKLEAASGILLLISAVVALYISNSNFSDLYFNVLKEKCRIKIAKNQLAYTFCQVPVVYTLSKLRNNITLKLKDGTKTNIKGNIIDKINSKYIFERTGMVRKIKYNINYDKIDQ